MLKQTQSAIERLEHQFKVVTKLDVNHLSIVATSLGRFNDEFLLYYHELELRKALENNPDIDVIYAREKMREFAWNIINTYEARELIAVHAPAIYNPCFKPDRDSYEKELSKTNRIKRYHKQVIQRLLGNNYVSA